MQDFLDIFVVGNMLPFQQDFLFTVSLKSSYFYLLQSSDEELTNTRKNVSTVCQNVVKAKDKCGANWKVCQMVFIFNDVVVFYPTEKVRPTFVHYRHGLVMLLDGYTYSKSTRLNWYCSRRVSCACKAKVKLTADEKYVDRLEYTHDHGRQNYVVSNSGNLIKLYGV